MAANIIQSFQLKFLTLVIARHINSATCSKERMPCVQSGLQKSLKYVTTLNFAHTKSILLHYLQNAHARPLTLVRHYSSSPLQVWYAGEHDSLQVATLVTRHAKTHIAAQNLLTLFCSHAMNGCHPRVENNSQSFGPSLKTLPYLGASSRRIMEQVIWVLTTKVTLKD